MDFANPIDGLAWLLGLKPSVIQDSTAAIIDSTPSAESNSKCGKSRHSAVMSPMSSHSTFLRLFAPSNLWIEVALVEPMVRIE